jgi:hypothetical protein
MRSQGAVLIGDLITLEECQIVGWPLLLTHVLLQVEQLIASRGVFFSGHSMSSVAGSITNYWGARGFNPVPGQCGHRTALRPYQSPWPM